MQQAATTRQHEITDVALHHALEAGVRVIPRAPLSHGDSPLTTGGGMPLLTIGSALPARPGSVRRIDYKTRVIRCSLWAGQGLITPARSACLSDAIATIGTSVGEGPDEPCVSPRLASEHQMTIGVRHELECYGSG